MRVMTGSTAWLPEAEVRNKNTTQVLIGQLASNNKKREEQKTFNKKVSRDRY